MRCDVSMRRGKIAIIPVEVVGAMVELACELISLISTDAEVAGNPWIVLLDRQPPVAESFIMINKLESTEKVKYFVFYYSVS